MKEFICKNCGYRDLEEIMSGGDLFVGTTIKDLDILADGSIVVSDYYLTQQYTGGDPEEIYFQCGFCGYEPTTEELKALI